MDIMDYKLPGDKKSKKKTKKPTLRFELDLPESTDNCCPEYSYIDLVRETLKERKSKGQNDTLCQNLLEEEEEKERDEARAIAEYYEIKYGATAATGQKRKRKDKGRDLVGAGYGYDENDPFVDDSEAYDEIVPASLTTQHGGFYINVGKLNFRTLSDDSDTNSTSSDDSVPLSHHAAKKKKAFRLLGSDESENEFKAVVDGVIKKKKRLKEAKVPGAKKRKMSLNGKDKVPGLKQRSKKMKKPTSLAQKLIAKAKAQQMMNASGVGSPGHPSNGAIPQYRKLSEDKAASKSTSGELGHLESKDLAQVAKQMTKELMSVGSSKVSPESDRKMENGFNTITPTTSASKNTPNVNHELPPNLPQMLGDRIDSLKKIAKSTEDTGKMKFFSSDVNRILLSIEESAQGLRNKERQGMYQHIAQHLPCSKDTLLKRVKKLQEEDSDQQLEGPIQRLKTAVDAVMTTQIEAYVLECDSKSEKFPSAAAAASTDEDEENEDRSMDGAGEKAKRTYAPRRKFKWDDNLRKLLWEVVAVKMNLYERFKVREKQTAEEYLKVFLESTIKPLWPKPWMQTRILFKESRSAHERLTLNCQKHKKGLNLPYQQMKLQKTFYSATMSDSKACSDVIKVPKLHYKQHNTKQSQIENKADEFCRKQLKSSAARRPDLQKKLKVRHTPSQTWKHTKKIKKIRLRKDCPPTSTSSMSEPANKYELANPSVKKQTSSRRELNLMADSQPRSHSDSWKPALPPTVATSSKPHTIDCSPVQLMRRLQRFKQDFNKRHNLLTVKPVYALDSAEESKDVSSSGSNKKVLGVNKEPSKPPDSSSNQRAISTVQNYGGQIETAAKIPKKQLIFDSAESKNSHFAAGTGGASKGASGVIDLTTAGGIELVASIEGDNFNKPKKGAMSQSKGAARTTPKELQGTWKPVTSNIKNTKIPAKTSSSLALSSVGTKKTDKKVEHKAKSNAGASNRVPDTFPMDSKMIQEYASDFVKLMMTPGQLPQAPGAYLGMQGLSNYDTISKILGLKPDDVMPQPKPTTTAQNDEKFQFKISSNPTISASKLDHFSPKGGFPPMDPTRKRVVQVLDSTSWMAQKSGSMKLPDKESGISTNHESYSSAPNLSPRSVPSPHSTSFNSKHVLAQSTSGFPPSFLIPPADSSKFITQRLKKSGHSQSPNQSNLDSATKIQKLSTAGSGTTSPKQNASPLTLPLSRQPYHHSGSPSAQSDPLLAGLPSMGLSPRTGQFSPARVGSSFSPAFTTPGGSPYSSTFKAPQSPVHKYPSVPMSIAGHPFGSSFTGYPQVQLVDIERNKDSVKHINVQGNQSR